jgi:anaerobic selenocysteine-containing dehydrogenase
LGGLCGAVDVKGGDTWPEGLGERELALYDEIPLIEQQPIGSDRYPVLYDLNKECNTPMAIDYMLGRGNYPLRALIMAGANPVNTNPNAAKVAEAFATLDLLVVRELFMTETAELAHYVLPAATFLERSELHVYPHIQWVSLSRKVLHLPGIIDEYSFWRQLAQRLGFGEGYFSWPTEDEVNRWLLEPTGITLDELNEHPEGLRYKPISYKKYMNRPFETLSGKFEFSSTYLRERGYADIPVYVEPYYKRHDSESYPYILITGARKRVFQHSRYRNIPRFRQMHPHAEIEVHPEDAEMLQISDGDMVRVTSEVGSIVIAAKIVSIGEILPGVVQITNGWWKESNVNRLTIDSITDPISGFPLMSSVPVQLERT